VIDPCEAVHHVCVAAVGIRLAWNCDLRVADNEFRAPNPDLRGSILRHKRQAGSASRQVGEEAGH
jgi:hypothetical protein